MGEGTNTVVLVAACIAAVAAVTALVCVAIIWNLVRREARPHPQPHSQPQQHPVLVQPRPQPVQYYAQPQPQVVIVQAAPPPGSVLLQRPWGGVAHAIGAELRREHDPTDRTRMAIDLGGLGGVDAARELVGAVRDGVISPTVGAHAIARAGFDAGVTVGLLSNDPDPRVRTFADLVRARVRENAPTPTLTPGPRA